MDASTPIYNEIGKGYNRTRTADPYLLSRMVDLLQATPEGEYLDLGCGTGNYTIPLHRSGIAFTGVDPSKEMLDKASALCKSMVWEAGVAEQIPLGNNAFDGALCSLTLHHWSSLSQGFAELARVLKPNAPVVIFTSTPEQMEGYWLNHYFPKMLADSIRQMPPLELVEDAMNQAGLRIERTEKYVVQPDLADLFLYSGKHNPQLYLNASVRSGISSFAALANAKEVANGLNQLQHDIASGAVQQIIDRYNNDLGDYLFVVARKPAQ